MKTKYLLLFIMLICSLTSKAEEKTVTFEVGKDSNTDTKAKFITKDGITITVTNGHFYRSDYYLFSSGCDVTFSSCVGKITNVHLNFGAKQGTLSHKVNNKNQFTNSTTKKAATWTGSLTSFTAFNSGESQVTSIAVTYDRSITMSSSTYATFWCEKAYTMPTGLMGYTISGVEDGCVIKGQTYDAGSLVPANTPLMLRGNAGSYAYTTSDDDSPVPTPNLLRCSDGREISEDGSFLYKYTYLSSTDHTLGFFWHSTDGHTMKVDYGKAYLAIPDDGAAGAKSLTLNDNWDVTDGIERSVTAEECENDIEQTLYDIHGVVHPKAESLKEGIYITKTGRKIVVRK